MMHGLRLRIVLFGLALLSASAVAGADDAPWAKGASLVPAGPKLAVGVDIAVDGTTGLSGGLAPGGSSANAAVLGHINWTQAVDADYSIRLAAYGSVLALAGRGPSERWLGDFQAASNIAGDPGVRVYSWWVEASRDRWSLRGGALLADEEFAGTVEGGGLINSSFGWPVFISANTVNTGPAFFVPAPGLRLQCTFGGHGAWQIGLYDGDSFDSPNGDPAVNRDGLHCGLGGAQGWFVVTEAALMLGASRFKAGGWLHTADFADLREAGRWHAGNFGGYAIFEHTLARTGGAAGNAVFFLRGGMAPRDRNTIAWALDGGLAWTGLLPSRSADVVTLGIAHAAFCGPAAQSEETDNPAGGKPDYEQVIEASYAFRWSETISWQPDLQYIRHLGGSPARGDALIFILRLTASF